MTVNTERRKLIAGVGAAAASTAVLAGGQALAQGNQQIGAKSMPCQAKPMPAAMAQQIRLSVPRNISSLKLRDHCLDRKGSSEMSSSNRIALFIDGANLFTTSRTLGLH
jgi:hypothetical protein